MTRHLILALLPLGCACTRAQPEPATPPPPSALGRSTVEQLCAQPERVQADWQPCELRDQSPTPVPITPTEALGLPPR